MGRRFDSFITGHADGGAAVETEPGKPEDEYAQRRQGKAVAGNGVDGTVFIVFADTGSQQPGSDAGAHTAYHVYRGGTGKIVEAQLGQPASAPDPVTGNGVDDQADGNTVNAVGRKFSPFCHGTGNDGGSRRTEYCLEDQECHRRKARVFCHVVVGYKEVRRADDAADIRAEHQPEPDDPERGRAQRKVHDIFHHDVAGVFCPGQTCFAHSKTGLHEEDQCGPQ